jgi:hypothetical protein
MERSIRIAFRARVRRGERISEPSEFVDDEGLAPSLASREPNDEQ